MYSKPRLVIKWLQYYFHGSNGKGHGIHSPFVFDLVTSVLNDKRTYYAYEKIEEVKKSLLRDERMIQIDDAGAGSRQGSKKSKKISDIARSSVSTQQFGRLLFRLANHYSAKTIIELGTSLGISAAYLASANHKNRVTTIDASDSIGKIARETITKLNLENIHLVNGNFNDMLDEIIATNAPADLVFIDGNHKKKAVLEYFEKFLCRISSSSLVIIHDIHWSREMEETWFILKSHPKVKMSIDIFSAGLIFFREEFQVKQDFILRFI